MIIQRKPSWTWSYGSWIYNYLCNQCLSPLKFEPRSWRGVLNTILFDKVCQWQATDRWFSAGTPVSSINKTDRHDITEILLKVTLNTIIHPPNEYTTEPHSWTYSYNKPCTKRSRICRCSFVPFFFHLH
jgi:hypothetical protein